MTLPKPLIAIISFPISAALLAACARPVGVACAVGIESTGRTYKQARLTWQHRKSGLIAAVKANIQEGRLLICGAWVELTGGENPNLTGKDADRAHVRLYGETIFGDLRSFRRATPGQSLRGESTTCVETRQGLRGQVSGKARHRQIPHWDISHVVLKRDGK